VRKAEGGANARGPGGAGRGWCAANRWGRQKKITRKIKL
jgi:hypothetical protein